ncbi:MAG: recombination mediator RecR [Bradymonadaceae bacterium]
MESSDPIANLVSAFSRLPGIGERTASRLAFYILDEPDELADELTEALEEVRDEVALCERCCNLTKERLCGICRSEQRDRSVICAVAKTPDLRAIEKTGEYSGTYHVLHGVISPLEGVGPEDLYVPELLERVESPEHNGGEPVEEVIVATKPSVDGEATSLYLSKTLKPLGIEVTRIASGVPIGNDLEYTDKSTLSRAIVERREL